MNKTENSKEGCRKERSWKYDEKKGTTRWHYCGDNWLCQKCNAKLEGYNQARHDLLIEVEKIINNFFEWKRIYYGKPATELNKALSFEMLRLSDELKSRLGELEKLKDEV